MTEHVISLSDFKANANQLLKRLQETDSTPLVLTQNGRASAVVQSYDDYQRRQKSLAMMKLLALGEADIQTDQRLPQDKVIANSRARLNARLKAQG